MPTQLKIDTVRFLTRDQSTERDRDAAKLLANCELGVKIIDPHNDPHLKRPAVDILIHADSEIVGRAHQDETAGRIENAMREACAHPIRHLQWVESSRSTTTGTGAGAGEYGSQKPGISKANEGKQEKPIFNTPGHGDRLTN